MPRFEAPTENITSSVLVPKSAYEHMHTEDGFSLIDAVFYFIAELYDGGVRLEAMPEDALNLFFVWFYMGQVYNGGHGQFISNAEVAYGPIAMPATLACLETVGALEHAQIFRSFLETLGDTTMSGAEFDDRLDSLDGLFVAAETAKPLQPRLRSWILSWNNLYILDDQIHSDYVRKLIELSPDKRIIFKPIRR
jgi:hypothetical protein